MKVPGTRMPLLFALLFLFGAIPSVYAQSLNSGGMVPRHTRKAPVDITKVPSFAGTPSSLTSLPTGDASTTSGTGGNIFGIQSVATFVGAFAPENPNTPSQGVIFPFIMMGNDPLAGGTTTIPTKITEISLQLLNADGSIFTTVPFTSTFEDVMTDSPNFANALIYDSSPVATQLGDAIQRAEFFHTMKSSWHTKLGGPTIVSRITVTVPFFTQVTINGNTVNARSYFTGTASDGSTFVLLLNTLFDSLYSNAVVNDINVGNFTTNAVNMDLFPNTFLFSLNVNNPNTPGGCCVLGFHTYFYEPGAVPQPQWVSIFASYISPGLFGAGFQDVTAMSHEISETFNDPFLGNTTPVWQFPGQPANSTVCQGNLETGDPIEVLANATTTISLTEGTKTLTFHPQNEALLEWFEMGATSNAVDGAFSYPNEAVLTASAVPCP
jgi:hypothetical protein